MEQEKERLLIVEDENKIARFLQMELEHEGFLTAVESNGRHALDRIIQEPFALVLLDLMLPEMDGVEICRRVRLVSDVPIIMLTAKDEIEDKVRGLDTGADDYLTKPFAFAELLARVRARLRNAAHQADDDVLRVGDLEIDRLRRQVRRAGRSVELTAREFDVLALLAQWRGQPVSRDLLAREVWKVNRRLTPLDNVIDVHLSHLRDKIDRDQSVKLIQTVRGVGFRLAEGAE